MRGVCVPRRFGELPPGTALAIKMKILKDIDRAAVAIRCLELSLKRNRWLGCLLPRLETKMTVSVLTLPASQETRMTMCKTRTTNTSRTRPMTNHHHEM